jgi:hypothetical protein
MVREGGTGRHQTLWLPGAIPIAGACRPAENEGSTVLDSTRSSEDVREIPWAESMQAILSAPFKDGPKTTAPVTGWIPKGAEAGGSTGMEAGCERTPAREGGAVPARPGRIG